MTGTIPGRELYLEECAASVRAQTYLRYEHLVLLDEDEAGCAPTYNELAEKASGEWLFVLADDDLMLPGCLRAHLAHSAHADIVYAPPLVWEAPHTGFWQEPPCIPATALIRRDVWLELGGYDAGWGREEDRRLFQRALEAGKRFVRVSGEPTWVYRLHAGSKSMVDHLASFARAS